WDNFGNMLGAAVIGGVNAAIRGINSLVQSSIEGLNSLISTLNDIPGVNLDYLGMNLGISEFANPYADQLGKNTEVLKKAIDDIAGKDYLGSLGDLISNAFSSDPVEDFAD